MVEKGTSGGECYGTYDSTSGTGSGAGYVNNCIHSGSNDYSGGNTVWYNYVVATAGTIKNSSSSDATGTTVITTESVCPKGWTLPTTKQIDAIGGASPGSTTYVGSFSPVLGGLYGNGTLDGESTHGLWWGSTVYNGALRYYLGYNGSSLYTYYGSRRYGFYVRCVSEEKDVSDLTYMQDMTPSVATNTAEGTTASLTDRRDGKVYTVAKINGNIWMTQNLRLGYNSSNPDTYTLDLTEQDSNITFTTAERTAGKRTLTLYDLVSRGKNSSDKCYGMYNTSTGAASGDGFSIPCIHSGIAGNTDIATTWYNYTLASAGTITGINNVNDVTESICPSGWVLPNAEQRNGITGGTYFSDFNVVRGGYYENGVVQKPLIASWWGPEANGYNKLRATLYAQSWDLIYLGHDTRSLGFYIRCVQAS